MFGCVFCYRREDNPDIHICGNCVWRLMYASDERLIEARDLALASGYTNKAEAIEEFTGINIAKGGISGKELKKRKKLKKTTKDIKLGGRNGRVSKRRFRVGIK
jgi:hypothetical protein